MQGSPTATTKGRGVCGRVIIRQLGHLPLNWDNRVLCTVPLEADVTWISTWVIKHRCQWLRAWNRLTWILSRTHKAHVMVESWTHRWTERAMMMKKRRPRRSRFHSTSWTRRRDRLYSGSSRPSRTSASHPRWTQRSWYWKRQHRWNKQRWQLQCRESECRTWKKRRSERKS